MISNSKDKRTDLNKGIVMITHIRIPDKNTESMCTDLTRKDIVLNPLIYSNYLNLYN